MTGKKKVILASALAIAMSASIITGTTLALFTSESGVNVAVTSAKVSVTAKVNENSIQTKQLGQDYVDGKYGVFAGGVELSAKGLTVDNIVPGDGVKFVIDIQNESTIAVKYRTSLRVEGDEELVNALKLTYNGTLYQNAEVEGAKVIFDGLVVYSKWAPMGDSEQVTIELELPEGTGNAAQDKSFNLSYHVEAVQGNANTSDPEAILKHVETNGDAQVVTTTSGSLQDMLNAAKPSDTIILNRDIETSTTIKLYNDETLKGGLTIEGNNYTIKGLNYNADILRFGAKVSGVSHHVETVHIRNLTLTGRAMAGIYLYGTMNKSSTLTNVHFDGEFKEEALNVASVGGCVLTNCTIKNTIAPQNSYWYTYGIPTPLGIFANRQVSTDGRGAVELINSHVDHIYVNKSSGYTAPKLKLDEKSTVDIVTVTTAERNCETMSVSPDDFDKIAKYRVAYVDGMEQDLKATYTEGKKVFAIWNATGLAHLSVAINGEKGTAAGYEPAMFKDSEIRLIDDIDLAGIEWQPINNFNATLEGNGHTVSNVLLTESGTNTGFFGAILASNAKHAVIKNLTLDKVSEVSDLSDELAPKNDNVAGLIGDAKYVDVENVHITNLCFSENVQAKYNGGLIGFAMAVNIRNCSVQGSMAARSIAQTGGLVGQHQSGEIKGCTVDLDVNGLHMTCFGGLVSFLNRGAALAVRDCYVKLNMVNSDKPMNVGGIAGTLSGNASNNILIENCYVSASFDGYYNGFHDGANVYGPEGARSGLGGLLGCGWGVTLNNCFVDAEIPGGQYLCTNCAGDYGTNEIWTLTNCSWAGGEDSYVYYGYQNAANGYVYGTIEKDNGCAFSAGLDYAAFLDVLASL